ncbi:MAG: hypothetical protein IKM05_08360 [Clostridia bacterium]|nr:hypothetical protein [Clostridia bacterium]
MDNEMMDDLQAMLEDALEDMREELEDKLQELISDSISEFFAEGMEEVLQNQQFVLKNGTVIQPRQRTKVLSPDKTRLYPCYGGLRIDGTTLQVQTRISSWNNLCAYKTKEEAVEALLKIKDAMEQGLSLIEL